jgi:hypothetical protein
MDVGGGTNNASECEGIAETGERALPRGRGRKLAKDDVMTDTCMLYVMLIVYIPEPPVSLQT